MKRNFVLVLGFLLVFGSMICANVASAEWSAEIYAQGEELEGANEAVVAIGVEEQSRTEIAAFDPPYYSVKMVIYEKVDEISYSDVIRQEGEESYKWIIAINPHGNSPEDPPGPPADRTATINWSPTHFDPSGYFELFKLTDLADETGTSVVEDMRSATSHEVTGPAGDQYFMIVFTTKMLAGDIDGNQALGLSDAILALKISAGITLSSMENIYLDADVNNDSKIGLEEAIYLLDFIADS